MPRTPPGGAGRRRGARRPDLVHPDEEGPDRLPGGGGRAHPVFRHSTTAGLRRFVGERITLPRSEWELTTPSGSAVRMKTLDSPDGPRTKPEYDDVVAEARRTGRPAHDLARELHEQAGGRGPIRAAGAGAVANAPKESE
ncbi:MAG: hypothetical protein DMD43_05350 [Gemmatimonadetes bacterium]|nr:MAG: hypothetical protein DMD43_05350 [Gemmatimonadota bacterium]